MRYRWWMACLVAVATLAPTGRGESLGNIVLQGGFGPNGDIGFATSPPNLGVTFGATGQGSIVQMDGFLNVPGVDFGSGPGMSADLANGAPAGFGYTFSETQPTSHQLRLSYLFVNNTGAAVTGLQFIQYTDADIGTSFPNDYATVNGSRGLPYPSSFQVGDPTFSTIFTNLGTGMLSNANERTAASPGDVSVAIGFSVGTLGVGQAVAFDVLLSDDGSTLGGFSITQRNASLAGDFLTVSGIVRGLAVPEPSSLAMLAVGSGMGFGFAALRRVRGRGRGQAWTRSQ